MNSAKIRLSAKEMELVTNADWILTKNGIIQKAKLLLEQLQTEQQTLLQSYKKDLPAVIIHSTPKISKGENYKGLPYLVLDYPRLFEKENICAIRTMFWWGNFFSVTLHLSGVYKTKAVEQRIIERFDELSKKNLFISVNDNEWEHHFEKENYLALHELGKNEFIRRITNQHFLKLSQKIPLEQWDNVQQTLAANFQDCLKLLVD
ncbi:MAG TPA: hypothetical protein VF487_00080 [Chitinophagaceae bacterium]